jgi:hypothetical protein
MLTRLQERQRTYEAGDHVYRYNFEVSQTIIILIYCSRPRSQDIIEGMVRGLLAEGVPVERIAEIIEEEEHNFPKEPREMSMSELIWDYRGTFMKIFALPAVCSGIFGVSGYLLSGAAIAVCGGGVGFLAGIAVYSLFYFIFSDDKKDDAQPDCNTVAEEDVGNLRPLKIG